MTVVYDATALISWMSSEVGADEVHDLISERGGRCSAVNLAEVIDCLSRSGRSTPERIVATITDLKTVGFGVEPCGFTLGARAGVLRATHYSRSTQPVSLADCIALATAEHLGATLVTSDAGLVAMAVSAGVDVHPIPNSSGVRPAVSP